MQLLKYIILVNIIAAMSWPPPLLFPTQAL